MIHVIPFTNRRGCAHVSRCAIIAIYERLPGAKKRREERNRERERETEREGAEQWKIDLAEHGDA